MVLIFLFIRLINLILPFLSVMSNSLLLIKVDPHGSSKSIIFLNLKSWEKAFEKNKNIKIKE